MSDLAPVLALVSDLVPKYITINNEQVLIISNESVSADHLDKALSCKKFQDWVLSIDSSIKIKSITFQSIDMFGPVNVGFIKFKCESYYNDKIVPGIVFMRGSSVSILIVLILPNGQKFVLLVKQPRVAIGKIYMEAVAGMMDGNGNFIGVAAKEIKEETGLEILEENLIPLGSIIPSPGGCDEQIELYAYEWHISEEEFAELEGKATGCIEEGEQIVLTTIPYEEVINSNDPKLVCAWAKYEHLHK